MVSPDWWLAGTGLEGWRVAGAALLVVMAGWEQAGWQLAPGGVASWGRLGWGLAGGRRAGTWVAKPPGLGHEPGGHGVPGP